MSSFGYLVLSLAVGIGFSAIIYLVRRREVGMGGWRLVSVELAAFLLGVGGTALIGPLIFGEQALPGWAVVTKHFWMPALGLVYFGHPNDEERRSMRWIGIGLIVGVLAITDDIHQFTART